MMMDPQGGVILGLIMVRQAKDSRLKNIPRISKCRI